MAQGFLPTQLNYTVRNGNDVVVMLGDQQLAYGQTMDSSISFGTEMLYGLGSPMPQEIQQLRFRPSITVSFFTLSTLGQQLAANSQDILNILANNQFDIHVFAQKSNTIIKTYVQCVADTESEHFPVNGIITGNIAFSAMDVWGPNGQSILAQPGQFAIAPLVANTAANVGLGI